MAVLTKPESTGGGYGPRISELAPKGTYLATIVDIVDTFGVVRPTYEDPTVNETVDLTIFVFGFKGKDGKLYLAKSRDMKISGNEKSNLYKFLTSLTGDAPKMGEDYCQLKGQGAQVTITHQESKRGTIYATLGAVAPVMEEVKDKVIPAGQFAKLLSGDSSPTPSGKSKPMVDDDDEEEGTRPF